MILFLPSEYKGAFDLFDMDGDGTITVEEIYKVLQSLGKHTSKDDIEKILSSVDVDGRLRILLLSS